jgi:putative addiction module killer protein
MPEARPREIRKYETPEDKCPFAEWVDGYGVGSQTFSRIIVNVDKLERGNFSNVESVGDGVFELKIDFGPGFRVYFGQDGDLVVLLGGGTKATQSQDIATAKEHLEKLQCQRAQVAITLGLSKN